MVWYKPWTWGIFSRPNYVTLDDNASDQITKKYTVDPSVNTEARGVEANAIHVEMLYPEYKDNWIEFYLHNMWDSSGDEESFLCLLCTTDVHEIVHEVSDGSHEPGSIEWDRVIADCTFPDSEFRLEK